MVDYLCPGVRSITTQFRPLEQDFIKEPCLPSRVTVACMAHGRQLVAGHLSLPLSERKSTTRRTEAPMSSSKEGWMAAVSMATRERKEKKRNKEEEKRWGEKSGMGTRLNDFQGREHSAPALDLDMDCALPREERASQMCGGPDGRALRENRRERKKMLYPVPGLTRSECRPPYTL